MKLFILIYIFILKKYTQLFYKIDVNFFRDDPQVILIFGLGWGLLEGSGIKEPGVY